MNDRPKPPFPRQQQPMPGLTAKMQPVPDHGENTYKGSGRLTGKKAVIHRRRQWHRAGRRHRLRAGGR
jgi:hypothetical protein